MIEKQNNMVIQHPDKRLMERIRSLERRNGMSVLDYILHK